MFNNKRYATRGVMENVNPILQLFLWQLVDSMPLPRDYLQVFKFSKEGKQLKITHMQEVPAYRREYLLDAPVFVGKIYAIDDGEQSTMLLANEY